MVRQVRNTLRCFRPDRSTKKASNENNQDVINVKVAGILLFLVLVVSLASMTGCTAGSTKVIFCQDIVPITLDPIYPSYELRTGTFFVILEAINPFEVETITTRFWETSTGVDRFVKEVTHEINPEVPLVALEFEIDEEGRYKASFLRPDGRRIASGQFVLR